MTREATPSVSGLRWGSAGHTIHPTQLPDIGYLRLPQIIGQREVTPDEAAANRRRGKGPRTPRPAIQPLIPVSRTQWYAGIRAGRYPAPRRLAPRTAVWAAADIRALLESGGDCPQH